jgi:hypothetical protein
MTAFVKRYVRVELVLLAAQLMAIGLMSLFTTGWEIQVNRAKGDPNTLPRLAALIYRHHMLVFGGAPVLLLMLYAICFHRFDRITAGRRFVVISLAALIMLTCVSVFGSLLAWDTIRQQSIKWKSGEKM